MLCAPAHARFFTSLVIVKSGTATCTSVGVNQPNSPSIAKINTPDAPNNVASTLTIDGGAPHAISEGLAGPFPIIDSVSNTPVTHLFAGAAQTMPYTPTLSPLCLMALAALLGLLAFRRWSERPTR